MFDELKTFMTVVECHNFTKAGEILHLSQPSVSAHIKNLELRFQTTLICRSVRQKNIVITDNGKRLYQYAKEVLQLTDQVSCDLQPDSNDIKGHLRIGVSLTISEYILPTFLATFLKKYPHIEVEFYVNTPQIISEQVRSLALDIGLIEGHPPSNQFIQESLLKDHLVLALPYHPNSKLDLDNERWLVHEGDGCAKEYLDLFLSSNEITPKQILSLSSNYAILECVKNGVGIAILSSLATRSAKQDKQISTYSLEENFHRYFSYILPSTLSPSHATECFLTELKKHVSHLTS